MKLSIAGFLLFGAVFLGGMCAPGFAAPAAKAEDAKKAEGAKGEYQQIRMTTGDKQQITGRLYGKGDVGLVLCHGKGYKKGGESFHAECEYFAKRKVVCLAIDFRGYPSDSPPQLDGREKDIVAAFDHLAGLGLKKIYILGSSMGGFHAFDAARGLNKRKELGGIIVLSAFDMDGCKGIDARKLFVVAKDDVGSYQAMQRMKKAAAEPKKFVAFDKGGHGQTMFNKVRDELLREICEFIGVGDKEKDPKRLAPGQMELFTDEGGGKVAKTTREMLTVHPVSVFKDTVIILGEKVEIGKLEAKLKELRAKEKMYFMVGNRTGPGNETEERVRKMIRDTGHSPWVDMGIRYVPGSGE